jgi:hypothetical protein
MLQNSKGLTRSFFLETWSMVILYKRVTLYTINFCSVCMQVWIASLLSLHNFIQRLRSDTLLLETVHDTQTKATFFTQEEYALILCCTCATSRSSPWHTSYTSTVCSWFSYLENTLDNVFVSLLMASVANVSPLVYSNGPQMNLASLKKHRWPWYSTRVPVHWYTCTDGSYFSVLRTKLALVGWLVRS